MSASRNSLMQDHIDKNQTGLYSHSELVEKDIHFWKSKSPQDRIAAIELMRQINFGYDPTTERLQRFLTIAERT